MANTLVNASHAGDAELVRALLADGADVARAHPPFGTPLMAASEEGHLECVRALLEAGANVAYVDARGWTALLAASWRGRLECVRALLEAGADVMQMYSNGVICALLSRTPEADNRFSVEVFQLHFAYAPSSRALRKKISVLPLNLQRWFFATHRWTSPLHHFEFLSLERVRALLAAGADTSASDGGRHAPTPLSLAAARLRMVSEGAVDDRAALIMSAAAPWSPKTHALFPAAAKARAVELLRIGWLLARSHQSFCVAASEREGALRDVWLEHVMPRLIERSSD